MQKTVEVNLIITDSDASFRKRTGDGRSRLLKMGLSCNQTRGVVSDNKQGKANRKAPSKDTSLALASGGTRTLSNSTDVEQC